MKEDSCHGAKTKKIKEKSKPSKERQPSSKAKTSEVGEDSPTTTTGAEKKNKNKEKVIFLSATAATVIWMGKKEMVFDRASSASQPFQKRSK